MWGWIVICIVLVLYTIIDIACAIDDIIEEGKNYKELIVKSKRIYMGGVFIMNIIRTDDIKEIREDLRGYAEAFAITVTYKDNSVPNCYGGNKVYLDVTNDLLCFDDDLVCIGYWQQPWQEDDDDKDFYFVHKDEARVLRRMGFIR